MFELSLVPEVKAKLIHQERLRNFVIFVCILVAIGCGAVILILVGIVGGQKLALDGVDHEIACRIDDSNEKGCKFSDTSIMQTANLNAMLSIQNELNNIGVLNENKTKPSRFLPTNESLIAEPAKSPEVFSFLEVALPSDNDYSFKATEMSIDFAGSTLTYDVIANAKNSKAQATAYANFVSSVNGSYFDYGDYYGQDSEGNSFKIPTYCIVGERIIEGYVYGEYNRYSPGCEALMVIDADNTDEDYLKQVSSAKSPEIVLIRRSYKSNDDFEAYKKGQARSSSADVANEAPNGFYFESNCMVYGDDGAFDEKATLEKCPIAAEKVEGTNKSEISVDDVRSFGFTVEMNFTPEIFKQSSHNVLFYSPSRRNVSDSYRAIEDFFTSSKSNTNNGGSK